MFIGRPPGNTDRILDFSTAVTGSLFFAPAADFLENPPDPPSAPAGAAVGDAASAVGDTASAVGGTSSDDGSLGIGSLKG
jgi:putative iron-dependent peroxidase